MTTKLLLILERLFSRIIGKVTLCSEPLSLEFLVLFDLLCALFLCALFSILAFEKNSIPKKWLYHATVFSASLSLIWWGGGAQQSRRRMMGAPSPPRSPLHQIIRPPHTSASFWRRPDSCTASYCSYGGRPSCN